MNKIRMTSSFVVAILLFVGSSSEILAGTNPNIVYFIVDDMGYADAGFNGSTEFKTPNIDQLARSGAILTDFYAQSVCSPTRAALLTGRYPTHTSAYGLYGPNVKQGFPLKERLLPQALHEVGYTTAICGKWHLGHVPEYAPTQRGFDHQYGCWDGGLNYFTHIKVKKLDWYRQDELCDEEGYTTHLITKEAVGLIEKQPAEKPLFLYVSYNAVHSPFQVPDSYSEPYQHLSKDRKTMGGLIASVDESIGLIVEALKAKGLLEETLIIFSSDNGGVYPDKYTDNSPLRDGKDSIYEGGIRVCAFATWPGKIPSGIRIGEPLHVIDWYPTLLKLAGVSAEQELPVDGHDIWPVLTQRAKSPHDEILVMGRSPEIGALRMGDWKLLVNPVSKDKSDERGKNKDSEEPADSPEDRFELYNLSNDISETKDLAATHPEKLQQLQSRFKELVENAVPLPNEKTTKRGND